MKTSPGFRMAALGFLMGTQISFGELPAYIIADTLFHPILDRTTTDLSNWQQHSTNWRTQYLGTDSATIYTDALSHPGSMTHLIYAFSTSRNIEMQFLFRMPSTAGANAGFQFRSRCQNAGTSLANNCGGSPWILCGPQNDLGSSYAGDIYNGCSGAYVNSGTASSPPRIINNNPTCKAGLNITVWNTYRFRVVNDTAWTFRNNVMCSKYFLTAATDVAATTQGMISLQYETLVRAEWRNIQIKNLSTPVVPILRSGEALRGESGEVLLNVREPGSYSVQVADVQGRIVRSFNGVGPVTDRRLRLGRPGVYVVQLTSSQKTTTRKVYVR